MTILIRRIDQNDIPLLEKMLADYMRETYEAGWGGTAGQLERDFFGGAFQMLVAETIDQKIAGFIAWVPTYDLHYCLRGGDILDFYVSPEKRGRGVGLLLAIEAAAEIQKCGGAFLKGGAVENPQVRRFYSRIAMIFSDGETYVSGRAFRHLAGLSGKNLREIARDLPNAAWNYEP